MPKNKEQELNQTFYRVLASIYYSKDNKLIRDYKGYLSIYLFDPY